jgi:dGTP triphosphohydrolase
MLPQRAAWAAIERQGPSADDRRDSNAEHDTAADGLAVWQAKARLICDHIAGMTDLYALHVHGEMFQGGGPPGLRLAI